MQILEAGLSMGVVAALCLCLLHGSANTLDGLAWALHSWASRIRTTHAARERVLADRWMGVAK